jgi:hypothetical protein
MAGGNPRQTIVVRERGMRRTRKTIMAASCLVICSLTRHECSFICIYGKSLNHLPFK